MTARTIQIVMLALITPASCMVWSQGKSVRRPLIPVTGPVRGASVSIDGVRWLINREVTYMPRWRN